MFGLQVVNVGLNWTFSGPGIDPSSVLDDSVSEWVSFIYLISVLHHTQECAPNACMMWDVFPPCWSQLEKLCGSGKIKILSLVKLAFHPWTYRSLHGLQTDKLTPLNSILTSNTHVKDTNMPMKISILSEFVNSWLTPLPSSSLYWCTCQIPSEA